MQLYDTLTRRKQELPPPPGPIRMYFCGPTVYTRVHVGNAVPFVLPLWLRNWLRLQGYEAVLVINVTDINDKIYDAAPGASAQLASDATRWYIEDTNRLGLGRPDFEPSATATVPEQIALIEQLLAAGFAYEADGDVYYRVTRFPDYGKLSNQRLEELEEQEPNARKEDPRDFALWKAHKPGEDTSWESPWGRGRPGWHIECSAMSELHFGPEFELHGGGLDLVFPHHENEIAQSRALGHRFAHAWMHNGMLTLRGEEMHKSTGHLVTLQAALDTWGRETMLVFYLRGHWRKPLDYSDVTLRQAAATAETLREVFRNPSVPAGEGEWERFAAALDDDFNTAEALAVMHSWRDHDLLRRALDVFGLASLAESAEAPAELVELARRREDARAAGDYAEGDRLRDEIAARGWSVRDGAGGYQLVPKQ
jgi:cysteinyl-tRNA synthetase